jgi:hypothetical protein
MRGLDPRIHRFKQCRRLGHVIASEAKQSRAKQNDLSEKPWIASLLRALR